MTKIILIYFLILGCSFEEPTKIINNTDSEYIEDIIRIGLDELDINPKMIYVRKLERSIDNAGINALVVGSGSGGNYVIYIKDFSKYKTALYIAHELIHILQEENGRLTYDRDVITYKPYGEAEQLHFLDDLPSYRRRGWEREAFKKQKKLSSIILERLDKKE